MSDPRRIVTLQQLRDGYATFANGVVVWHKYEVIENLADGNYVVVEPRREALERQP